MVKSKKTMLKAGGAGDYLEYLRKQLAEANDSQKLYDITGLSYHQNGMSVSSMTRCEGELAKSLGIEGPLDEVKLKMLAELQGTGSINGEFVFDRAFMTKPNITREYIVKDGVEIDIDKSARKLGCVADSNGKVVSFKKSEIQVVKDGERLDRVMSLEYQFTLDKSFSVLIMSEKPENRDMLIQKLMQIQDDIIKTEILPNCYARVASKGEITYEKGETMYYSFMHIANRGEQAHIHPHALIPNAMKMPDGKFRSIDMSPFMNPKFNMKTDALYNHRVARAFKEMGYSTEAYNKEKQTVSVLTGEFDNKEVATYRVKFSKETQQKVMSLSDMHDRINKEIKNAKEKETKSFNKDIELLKARQKSNERTTEDSIKHQNLRREQFKLAMKHIDSSAFEDEVQARLKSAKIDRTISEQVNIIEKGLAAAGLTKDIVNEAKSKHPEISFAVKTDAEILRELTDKKNVFDEDDLLIAFAKNRPDIGDIKGYVKALTKSHIDLCEAKKIEKPKPVDGDEIPWVPNPANPSKKFTLVSLHKLERENLDALISLADSPSKNIKLADADKTIGEVERHHKVKFRDEQKDFIRNVFSDKNLSLVQGLPGTGKSFTIQGCKKIADAKGLKVIALAPTGSVVSDLKTDIGLDDKHAMTIDKALLELAKGKLQLDDKTLLFVDEAGMVGSRNFSKLVKHVEKSGAKLVLVGDHKKIDPVVCGIPFSDAVRHLTGKGVLTRLKDIARQKGGAELENANLVSGGSFLKSLDKSGMNEEEKALAYEDYMSSPEAVLTVFAKLEQDGKVDLFEERDDMLDAIVEDYIDDKNDYRQKLITASKNPSVDEANERIHKIRHERGEVGADECTIKNGDRLQTFSAGDRVILTQNGKADSGEKVQNGKLGTILSIEFQNKEPVFEIEFDDKIVRKITANEEMAELRLGYAISNHKSQGKTVNTTYSIVEKSLVNNSNICNVSFTRNRSGHRVYGVEDEYEDAKAEMARASDKDSLLDYELVKKQLEPSILAIELEKARFDVGLQSVMDDKEKAAKEQQQIVVEPIKVKEIDLASILTVNIEEHQIAIKKEKEKQEKILERGKEKELEPAKVKPKQQERVLGLHM